MKNRVIVFDPGIGKCSFQNSRECNKRDLVEDRPLFFSFGSVAILL